MPGNDHHTTYTQQTETFHATLHTAAYSENDVFYATLLNALLTITTR